MEAVSTISDPLSKDLLYKRIFLMDPSKMDMDRDKMAERILHLTLEILFRLTGEDCTVVKKTSSDRYQDPVPEEWGRPLSPITGPPPHPLIHEDINNQKIQELAYKMIELLTGEVPIRCQDVAVYFSMEEWEYLEGHKDLYKDVMMEVPQPITSPVLSSKRTTPERCPRPLLPQDCKQEDPNVPQDHQGEDLTHINTTETYVRGDERCKEEIPTYDYPDSIITGSVPQDWRIENVMPIFKKGTKTELGNYRPVSLTSTVGKVLEGFLRDAILEYLKKNNLMTQYQHGFTRDRSCQTNLISFYEEVSSGLDQGNVVDVVYMDFSKAFDTVLTRPWACCVAQRLAHGGLPGTGSDEGCSLRVAGTRSVPRESNSVCGSLDRCYLSVDYATR
ncbi:uncharacterized protein [Phyllobates terribilis]|uniref:uncharacterized protein n=1 Tax=Phyllobates terribilis TaxID=111132 RepID=UPI003CCB5C3D